MGAFSTQSSGGPLVTYVALLLEEVEREGNSAEVQVRGLTERNVRCNCVTALWSVPGARESAHEASE